jgi:hypothetical protein
LPTLARQKKYLKLLDITIKYVYSWAFLYLKNNPPQLLVLFLLQAEHHHLCQVVQHYQLLQQQRQMTVLHFPCLQLLASLLERLLLSSA